MIAISRISTITDLTFREARRRRLLWLGLGLGIAFVALYATGYYFAYQDFTRSVPVQSDVIADQFASAFLSAGLYVVNFLIVVVTVLTSVGSVSSEVQNNTIHAIAAKPIRRWEIILGKWFGYALMVILYTLILAIGPMLTVFIISGYTPANAMLVIAILVLECLVILSLTMLASSLMSTLAAGVVAFMMYGLAFIGGWVEQIGAFFDSRTAVDIGIASSLLVPSEALWRYASVVMQPTDIPGAAFVSPFTSTTQPSTAFVIYAIIYTVVLLGVAMWSFSQRDF